jgi:mannitol-1-phosphate/altronate dehydrogenase
MPVDPASVAASPGAVIGGLLFQVVAQTCDGTPIPVLPAEVNLGIHYSDGDASGRNESSFTIARLDTNANRWQNVDKQANDPPANFASATITEMGYFVLYQR